MSLDDVLPDCDFEDCWSRNNPDRAYGDKGREYTANGDNDVMESRWIAQGGDEFSFNACDVCAANAAFSYSQECSKCCVVMIRRGLVNKRGDAHYCESCVDIGDLETAWCSLGESGDFEYDWLDFADADPERDHRTCSIMYAAIDLVEEKEQRKNQKLEQKLEQENKSHAAHIKRLFPEITNTQLGLPPGKKRQLATAKDTDTQATYVERLLSFIDST